MAINLAANATTPYDVPDIIHEGVVRVMESMPVEAVDPSKVGGLINLVMTRFFWGEENKDNNKLDHVTYETPLNDLPLVSENPDVETVVQNFELGTALLDAFTQIRPAYQQIAVLRFVQDQSYEEIAATLNIPIGTVRTGVSRAREDLQGVLGEFSDWLPE